MFSGRFVFKIALATLLPVAVAAGLGFFWEYRDDRLPFAGPAGVRREDAET